MKRKWLEFVDLFKKEVNDVKNGGDIRKQIPNMLTFSRALAPLIMIPTLMLDNITLALIEVIFFALTDFLDGKIARKYNCVSIFGIKLDALCDKIFVIGLIIPSLFKYPILGINLFFELAISYVNVKSEVKNNEPRSIMSGKIKSAILFVTLVLTYVPNTSIETLNFMVFTTAIFQFAALIQYYKIDNMKDIKK